MDKNYKHWGYHLLIDAGQCDPSINNIVNVRRFLTKLVKKIKMIPIGSPMIVYVDTEEGKGVSGIQLITTSTITFHGDDLNKCVYLDVFSCKPFKKQDAIDLFVQTFNPQKIKHKWVYRDAL